MALLIYPPEIGSVTKVTLGLTYVRDLLQSADQFSEIIEVGREDKLWTSKQILEAKTKGEIPTTSEVRPGDVRIPGIRTIWSNIYSSKVFTVNFDKQSKELSDKQVNDQRTKQLNEAVELIVAAQKGKTGVANKAIEVINNIQNNPILPIIKGEERTLRRYKRSFESTTGYYDVVDMDIVSVKPGDNHRQVHINQINWLVVDNKKYIVK